MSLNKKQLGNDTKSARKTPPVRQPNQNAPAFFMEDPRQLLPKNLIQPMYKHGGPHTPTTDPSVLQVAIKQVASENSVGIDGLPDVNITSFEQIYPEIRNAIQERYNALIQQQPEPTQAMQSYEEGGGIIKQHGWEYKQSGNEYLTRQQGNTDWITAKGKARDAIQTKVYGQSQPSAPVMDPAQMIQTKQELKNYDINQTGDADYVRNIQSKLVNAGYDLGKYGVNKDGVDGVYGNATKNALEAFNSGISPEYAPAPSRATKTHRTPKITKKTAAEVKKDLQPGILPTFSRGTGEEVCVKGKGCSYNVSVKMGNLLGDAAGGAGNLWAEDAWFNKSDLIEKGGELIYETSDRNINTMPKVPTDLYDKFQVGDYVQLNRKDTPSSKKFAAQTKSGLQNENIEHMGFIIGKDEDGTPLLWHGSESGKAYIQRIDENLSLPDHKSLGNYEIASVVRNKALTNNPEALKALEESAYYSPINEDNVLIPSKNASLKQKQMASLINESIGDFKSLGYNQEDLTYLGQILVGGIMENETSGGESLKAYPKEVAATLLKNVMGFGDTEASKGVYQLKPKMNLKDKDGNLNSLGQQLEKLGVDYNDVAGSSEAQTKAGLLMLLDAYKDLKNDPNFDAETNLYMGKIPASYIVAKSWQAGKGWQNRDKYKTLLNELDVDYSWSALENATNNIAVADSEKNLSAELEAAKAMKLKQDRERREAERIAYYNSAEGKKALAEQAEKDRVAAEWAKYNSPRSLHYVQPSESTGVNVNTQRMPVITNPYREYGGDINMFDHGGPHDRYGKRKYVGYDRLLQDWDEQIKGDTPWGDKGQLFYQGYDSAIGDYSPLHPNVRKLIDMKYLEDYVSQAAKSSGIYGGSGDNAYEKKAMMGQIPVRFDEAGKAQILTDARGGFGGRGKGIKGVEYFPVNWEQYMYDQTSDPTNEVYGQSSVHNQQFLPPVTVEAEAMGYQKKMHRMPMDKRKALVDKMSTLEEMYRQENNIPLGEDSGISREQLYNLAVNNKELSAAADEYATNKTEYLNQLHGTVKKGAPMKKASTYDKFMDVISHPFDFFQASMGTGNASDLWDQQGGRSWRDTREMYKQAGEDVQINNRGTSMVGNTLNVWNPARFQEDTKYNLKAERYGDIAWDLAEVAAPAIGKYAGKAGKYVGGKLAPYYDKLFASTKMLDKGITGMTKSYPKLQSNLLKGSKYANFNNIGFATSVGAEIPLINRYAKDPTWGNAGMLAYNTWGLIPGVGYSKKAYSSGKRYVDDVVGASKSAGKFQLPKYKNVYRVEPTDFNKASNAEEMTGRWFADNPAETQFYVKNLKSANPTEQIRIMRTRMPQHKIEKQFGAGMPEEARMMSTGLGDFQVSDMDKVLGPGASKRWTAGKFTTDDMNAMQSAPFLYRPTEGILNPSLVNKMRAADVTKTNPFARSRTTVFPDKGSASTYLFDLQNKVNQPGISQYSPFSFRKQGGDIKGGTPIWEGLF